MGLEWRSCIIQAQLDALCSSQPLPRAAAATAHPLPTRVHCTLLASHPTKPFFLLQKPPRPNQTVAITAQRRDSVLRSKRLRRDQSLGSLGAPSRGASTASLGEQGARRGPDQHIWSTMGVLTSKRRTHA